MGEGGEREKGRGGMGEEKRGEGGGEGRGERMGEERREEGGVRGRDGACHFAAVLCSLVTDGAYDILRRETLNSITQ